MTPHKGFFKPSESTAATLLIVPHSKTNPRASQLCTCPHKLPCTQLGAHCWLGSGDGPGAAKAFVGLGMMRPWGSFQHCWCFAERLRQIVFFSSEPGEITAAGSSRRGMLKYIRALG